MERYASCVRLRPEHRERYLELHANVWPEVESMLAAANIRNYTIFLRGDVLFSYYETSAPTTPRTRRVSAPIQRPSVGGS